MNIRVTTAVDGALERALDFLRVHQLDGRRWVGRLSSSALATSMALVALEEVNPLLHRAAIQGGRRWLFDTQHADGGWGDAVVDDSNINATSLAIGALTLTNPDARADDRRQALLRAHDCLNAMGGFDAVGDPARCTLSGPCRTVAALAALMDWHAIKRLRPEVILIPPRLRRTISTTFPAYLSISTLHSTRADDLRNRLPTYVLARRRVLEWLRRAQGADGSFEESAFLTSVIVACLHAAGDAWVSWLAAALDFVRRSQRSDGSWPIDRDLETFDTAMTVLAFDEVKETVPNADGVRRWLLERQFDQPCFATSAPAGGWAWAMPAGWPECDDTAFTIAALLALDVPPTEGAIQRGLRWLEGMQNRDGSWSTFVRNSRMPFDHDCPYITGHVLSALGRSGQIHRDPSSLNRAIKYLRRGQRADGSFKSIWFRERTAGTASVIEGLADCGLADSTLVSKACAALVHSQNADGGWGGIKGQASTAEETAWAVLALQRIGGPDSATAIKRGLAWLMERQRSDGGWDEWPIGLYYSAMWYADSSFAITLPAQALARAGRLDHD